MEKALSPAASRTKASQVATATILSGTHLCNIVNWDDAEQIKLPN